MSACLPKTLPNSLLLTHASEEDAIALAKELLQNSAKVDSGNHPDLHLYRPEGKTHPMANMQKLIREMALPPFEAPCKVFILFEADSMLPASSNALLKTLEEPASDTYFLLLSSQPDRLLPTILSRLYPLNYSPKEYAILDLSTYFALATQEKWDELFDALPNLEEEDPEILLSSCLDWAAAQKDPALYHKMLTLVERGKRAIQHNVKLLPTFLDILLGSTT